MNIPLELQDRLIEVLRTTHDNAVGIHQEAQERCMGYKQHRIDALGEEAEEVGRVLDAVLELKGEQK